MRTHTQHSSPAEPQSVPCQTSSNQHDSRAQQQLPLHTETCSQVTKLISFTVEWTQSAYINENIKKENWDCLPVLPSKYKGKDLIRVCSYCGTTSTNIQCALLDVSQAGFLADQGTKEPRGSVLLCINADRCSDSASGQHRILQQPLTVL